ncbi:predicted protein [Sparassis crispa]|uniref:Guanine nucleotide-binding protein alpha-4 subunit n=1 Tax=Sparassis crispa TaxID=139825 RepID=A0A401GYU8_9APHY|nr:predicted protein [Sparassis crispa]GBE87343.1 predicted protein [Sparassis crispa]
MPTREPPDPLEAVLRPPADETPAEQAFRLAQEAEARRVSAAIDESIRQERVAHRKARVVRLLLLGQSESGKSTTLRQFQRLYTPSAFRAERVLWRAVVQLNLVRSVNLIQDALLDLRPADLPSHHHHRHPHASPSVSPAAIALDLSDASSEPSYSFSAHEPSIYAHAHDDPPSPPPSLLPPHLAALLARLAPLRHVEALLVAALSPPDTPRPRALSDEIFVRPGSALKRAMRGVSGPEPFLGNGKQKERERGAGGEADAAQAALHACAGDLLALWRDPVLREILRRRRIRVEDGPGFFLDDLERITAPRYLPSDDDVLKARLKTVGVSEYRFEMEAGSESGTQWRIIDVGGSRSQVST